MLARDALAATMIKGDDDDGVDVDREEGARCVQGQALTLRTHCPTAAAAAKVSVCVCAVSRAGGFSSCSSQYK